MKRVSDFGRFLGYHHLQLSVDALDRHWGANLVSKHVLTVDDEAGIRRLVQLNLERAGYRVSTAIDGVDGLDKVAAELPDLVILDITMPRMDGTLGAVTGAMALAMMPMT